MIIRVKKDAKDRILGPQHRTYSRREFIEAGIATTTMATAIPSALAMSLAKSAEAGTTPVCPPASSGVPGGVGHLNGSGGGFSIGAYILSGNANTDQLNLVASSGGVNAANMYGVTGGAMVTQCFANGGVAADSPFGATMLTPPAGISATAWTQALSRVSVGGNLGASPNDDGAGENLGQIGAISPYKQAANNTDIYINKAVTQASFAQGLGPQISISGSPSNLTTAKLATSFGITPAANTNATLFANTAAAATQLGSIFSTVFGGARTGAPQSLTAAACGFQNDAVMASTTYGTGLVTVPASVVTASGLQTGSLSAMELAFLGAYYASNQGQVGAIVADNQGADYHGQSAATISAFDGNMGLQVRAWLLAAMLSQQPSVMFITTNGQAGCSGTQAGGTITTNGTTTGTAPNGAALATPAAAGDEGGRYSAHWMLAYAPNNKPMASLKTTGTISNDGGAVADNRIVSVSTSVASMYFTALQFFGLPTTGFSNVLASKGIVPVSLI
jgi:hypothetical protein